MKTYFGSATFILIFINVVSFETCVYVTGCRQCGLYTVTVDLCVINEYRGRLLSASWSNTMHTHSQTYIPKYFGGSHHLYQGRYAYILHTYI